MELLKRKDKFVKIFSSVIVFEGKKLKGQYPLKLPMSYNGIKGYKRCISRFKSQYSRMEYDILTIQ